MTNQITKVGRTYYFVLAYDAYTNEWLEDTDAEREYFSDGTIYDHDTDNYSTGCLGDGEYDENEDPLYEVLKKGIACLQQNTIQK
jgi:hypothetical protein